MAPTLNVRSRKSRAEWVDWIESLRARARAGELTLDEEARWSFGAETSPYDGASVVRKERLRAIEKNLDREREWVLGWPERNPGAEVP
jgi:hypothetical protein